jgi:hypothetical protein
MSVEESKMSSQELLEHDPPHFSDRPDMVEPIPPLRAPMVSEITELNHNEDEVAENVSHSISLLDNLKLNPPEIDSADSEAMKRAYTERELGVIGMTEDLQVVGNHPSADEADAEEECLDSVGEDL